MKLIMDIDKETYKKCKWKNNGVVGLEWWERAIANGTPIPDNATNGDVIEMMFPNLKITKMNDCVSVIGEHYEFNNFYPFDFWNAPYQKGGKE